MCTHLDKTNSTYYFRRPVPKDLVGCFVTATGKARTEWKFSLGTKDREEAKRLLRPHVTETDSFIDNARQIRLRATSGAVTGLADHERVREEQAAQATLEAASRERRAARSEVRTLLRQRLRMTTAELSPEQASAVDLIKEKDAELEELRRAVKVIQAGNDWLDVPRRPVDGPSLTRAPERRAGATPVLTLTALFDDYAKSGAATAHTVAKWRAAVSAFVKYLGHDDAREVTRANVSGWLKSLVASGLSVRTVQGTYRAAVARVFKLAHGDGLLTLNVAAAIEVRGPKAIKTTRYEISDDEAEVILNAALDTQISGIGPHHALARRWAPWICAYTGSRIAEVTQMRACDIRQEEGVWVFRITPEAGGVKNRTLRLVPVHSHLIEQGVLTLARVGDQTPLFYDPDASRKPDTVQKQPQQVGSKLAKWVRGLGVTEVAQPNHGWRHRFKTVARTVNIPADVRDTIQGHAARTEGEKYGVQPLSVLQEAIERLPRYEVARLTVEPQ